MTARGEPLPRVVERTDPLSPAQRRLWLLNQLEPWTPACRIALAVRLSGVLDVEALRGALEGLIERHESLRTTFPAVDGAPVQAVGPTVPVPLPVTTVGEREVDRTVAGETRKAFDLAHGPLVRARLLRLSLTEHVLLVVMSRMVADRRSGEIFLRELGDLYQSCAAGEPSPLPPLAMQYADFAGRLNAWLQGDECAAHLAHWRTRLLGMAPVLELPQARPRLVTRSHRGAREPLRLAGELTGALASLAHEAGTTLEVTLLAAFQALLARYSGRHDIVVGVPVDGRDRAGSEGPIGCFSSLLVMRADLSGDPSFRELLRRARETWLEAARHGEVPFDTLVEDIRAERTGGHHALVQVLFEFRGRPAAPPRFPHLLVRPMESGPDAAPYDLALSLTAEPSGLGGWLAYATDLFDADTMARLTCHYRTLLEAIAGDPNRRLSELPLLTAAEGQRTLVEWNQTAVPYPHDRCVHQLIEAQVARTPDATAVVHGERRLTYGELNRRANRLAHRLRALGIGPEVRVGLCLERSTDLMTGLLAIWKAGGAYLPLDPNAPAERLALLLADAGVRVVVTGTQDVAGLARTGVELLRPEADGSGGQAESESGPASCVRLEHAAYVIYTSGSTGRPKGVMVEHRSLLNYVLGVSERLGFAPGASFALVQPLTVDASVTALFPPLLAGGCVHLISEELAADPAALARYFERHPVDCLKIAPSHLAALKTSPRFDRILPRRWLVVGGEASRRDWVEQLQTGAPACRIFNHYGPTETTVGALTHEAKSGAGDRLFPMLPIGRPLPNVTAYVLDRHAQPVPVGVPGELYLGGTCVARGYLGQPGLTAAAFVPDGCGAEAGARLYRTGDLARYRPDGTVEFLGRRDDQLKIRGFRVEPGEIEAALSRHPSVAEVVVAARTELAAYLVLRPGAAVTVAQLRDHLSRGLPAHMVPQVFVLLERLPRTPHGKVDRQALPEPPPTRPELDAGYLAPRTPVERGIARIWCEVLRLERVGVHDNFFELGGHSLRAAQVVARVRVALNVELPLRAIFEAPTVAGLALAVGDPALATTR